MNTFLHTFTEARRFLLLSGLCAAVLGAAVAATNTEALVTIETVPVGNPNNPKDKETGLGAVPYEYAIGKYVVTVGQYVTFLNAKAAVTTNPALTTLWNEDMEKPASYVSAGFIQRTGSGTQADPYLYAEIADPPTGPSATSAGSPRHVLPTGSTMAQRNFPTPSQVPMPFRMQLLESSRERQTQSGGSPVRTSGTRPPTTIRPSCLLGDTTPIPSGVMWSPKRKFLQAVQTRQITTASCPIRGRSRPWGHTRTARATTAPSIREALSGSGTTRFIPINLASL